MTITGEVRNRISAMQPDVIFSYRDLNIPMPHAESVIKELNRMVQYGHIEKFARGKFYKPVQSVFGKLKPNQEEIVKDLLLKDGKRIGYVTGYAIFNKFALTTQVPNVVQIGTRVKKNKRQRGIIPVVFLLQHNEITDENVPLLQLLDSIRMIKEIPDADVRQSCRRLLTILKEYENELERLIELSMNYSPATRALFGAMVENLWGEESARSLYESLNPLSYFLFGIDETVLPQMKKWRIK